MGSNPECPSEVTKNAGLYVLAARDIFRSLSQTRHSALQLYVSCFEIYGGKLYDLLNERNPIKVSCYICIYCYIYYCWRMYIHVLDVFDMLY